MRDGGNVSYAKRPSSAPRFAKLSKRAQGIIDKVLGRGATHAMKKGSPSGTDIWMKPNGDLWLKRTASGEGEDLDLNFYDLIRRLNRLRGK